MAELGVRRPSLFSPMMFMYLFTFVLHCIACKGTELIVFSYYGTKVRPVLITRPHHDRLE